MGGRAGGGVFFVFFGLQHIRLGVWSENILDFLFFIPFSSCQVQEHRSTGAGPGG